MQKTKLLDGRIHTCYVCGIKFTPRKSSYGEPEKVMTTLYEYGCKPICYPCYSCLEKNGFLQRFFNKLSRLFTS